MTNLPFSKLRRPYHTWPRLTSLAATARRSIQLRTDACAQRRVAPGYSPIASTDLAAEVQIAAALVPGDVVDAPRRVRAMAEALPSAPTMSRAGSRRSNPCDRTRRCLVSDDGVLFEQSRAGACCCVHEPRVEHHARDYPSWDRRAVDLGNPARNEEFAVHMDSCGGRPGARRSQRRARSARRVQPVQRNRRKPCLGENVHGQQGARRDPPLRGVSRTLLRLVQHLPRSHRCLTPKAPVANFRRTRPQLLARRLGQRSYSK
jgi:hypothetical protein